MRRLAFYLARENYLKVMAPVIDHLVTHGADRFRVVALLPWWSDAKPAKRMSVESLRSIWGDRIETREMQSVDDFDRAIAAGAFDALLNLQPFLADVTSQEEAMLRASSVKAGTKWVALPEGFSQDQLVINRLPSVLANWDVVCTVGPRSMRYIEKGLEGVATEAANSLKARLVVVGYPEFDGLKHLPDDRAIRDKYGLPQGKPVLFVATAPSLYPWVQTTLMMRGLEARFREVSDWSVRGMAARLTSYRYQVLVPYRRYLTALRRFADRNGACLVAKTREKNRDPEMVRDHVDLLVGDRAFFPFTTLELLRVSGLYFGFHSASVTEAAVCGVYALTACFMPTEVAGSTREWRQYAEFFHWGHDGLWRAPGIGEVLSGADRTGFDALDRLSEAPLDRYRVDRERQRHVLADFFSHVGDSSPRVIDALSMCWA